MRRGFHHRLARCVKVGDLIIADLHHWFDRPSSTVRMWLIDGWTPRGPAGKLAVERLDLLERAIKEKRGLPPPRELSALRRPKYIKQVRDELERARVPQTRFA